MEKISSTTIKTSHFNSLKPNKKFNSLKIYLNAFYYQLETSNKQIQSIYEQKFIFKQK